MRGEPGKPRLRNSERNRRRDQERYHSRRHSHLTVAAIATGLRSPLAPDTLPLTPYDFVRLTAHFSFYHFVFEQPAVKRAVEQRRPLGHGEVDQLRQPHIRAEKINSPAGELFF